MAKPPLTEWSASGQGPRQAPVAPGVEHVYKSHATVVRRAMQGCDAVVHLAAVAIERHGQTYEDVNARGTEHVLDAMRAGDVRRLVHMSQNFAASTSPHRFLRSKGMAEDAVRASDTEWTILRPSVIFGRSSSHKTRSRL